MTRSLDAGQAASLLVSTGRPGEVELQGLGLTSFAEPLAPARFDVLVDVPGRYPVRFTPVAGGEARTAGVLQVTP